VHRNWRQSVAVTTGKTCSPYHLSCLRLSLVVCYDIFVTENEPCMQRLLYESRKLLVGAITSGFYAFSTRHVTVPVWQRTNRTTGQHRKHNVFADMFITGSPTHSAGGQTSNGRWRLSSSFVCRRHYVVVCNTPQRACRRLHPRRLGDDVMSPPV